jgi:predicted nucleotidyltransferase
LGVNAAERIQSARRLAAMTQQELAERSGVRQPNIAAYENGRRQPSPAMLARLLDAARPRPSVLLARFREQVLEIAARNHAEGVRVFGSIARGEDSPESDVDLLVTFGPEASLLDQAGLIAELEDLLGAHVDVVSDRALKDRMWPSAPKRFPCEQSAGTGERSRARRVGHASVRAPGSRYSARPS